MLHSGGTLLGLFSLTCHLVFKLTWCNSHYTATHEPVRQVRVSNDLKYFDFYWFVSPFATTKTEVYSSWGQHKLIIVIIIIII